MLRFILFFVLSVNTLYGVEGFYVLTNSDVPFGKELAKRYCAIYDIDQKCILSVSMDKKEILDDKEYLLIKQKIQEILKGKKSSTILTVYGVPLIIKKDDFYVSFDQKISEIKHPTGTGYKQKYANPYFYRVAEYKKPLPIFVSRLDAPNQQTVLQILFQWEQMNKTGAFKRYLVPNSKKLKQVLDEASLFTQKESYQRVPINEIQFMSIDDKSIVQLCGLKMGQKMTPGALIFNISLGEKKYELMRQTKLSPLSAGLYLRPSFYISALTNLKKEGQHFDIVHFYERFTSGETFVQSAWGAMSTVCNTMIIIGDPLYSVFEEKKIKKFDQYFLKPNIESKNKIELFHYNNNLNWFTLRNILADWQKGDFNMALGKLEWACLKVKNNDLFFEKKCEYLYKLGKNKDLKKTLKDWVPLKSSRYYQLLKFKYNKHLETKIK
jgi:hypothetical protein